MCLKCILHSTVSLDDRGDDVALDTQCRMQVQWMLQIVRPDLINIIAYVGRTLIIFTTQKTTIIQYDL